MSDLKIISLFTGAAGMDIGFEKAGFEVVVAIESDSACCDTIRLNMPKTSVIQSLIEEVSTEKILKQGNLNPLEAALVIGGPPCQPFSMAGKRDGLNDKRGHLLKEFARIVKESLPTGFVLENVKGLLNWGKGSVKEAILREFTSPIEYKKKIYQYKVECRLLNALDYGVPQHRERVIFVGNRIGVDFKFPDATHGEINLLNQGLKPYRTVWEAIGDLPPAEEPSNMAKIVANSVIKRKNNHEYTTIT